jgi:hypothetical protein
VNYGVFLIGVATFLVSLSFLPPCFKRETCGATTLEACAEFCGEDGVQVFETPSIIVCNPRSLSRCQCQN